MDCISICSNRNAINLAQGMHATFWISMSRINDQNETYMTLPHLHIVCDAALQHNKHHFLPIYDFDGVFSSHQSKLLERSYLFDEFFVFWYRCCCCCCRFYSSIWYDLSIIHLDRNYGLIQRKKAFFIPKSLLSFWMNWWIRATQEDTYGFVCRSHMCVRWHPCRPRIQLYCHWPKMITTC